MMAGNPWLGSWIALFLCLALASGCGVFRSELFRGETLHLLDKGNRHYRSGEFQEAGACYRKAAEVDPECARAHAALGHVAYVKGDFLAAADCYEQAVDLDSELEKLLAPLLMDALRMQEKRELEACGARLQEVLELLFSGREGEVESVLSRDVSAAMLARHMTSLSSRDRERLLGLAEDKARTGTIPPRCALLYGHVLAADERHGVLAARLLESAAKRVEGEEQQKAWMTLAALHVRLGRESEAAWAYEAALEAGCPRDKVLPLIARLYGMPASAVAPKEQGESGEPGDGDEAAPSVLSHGTLSGSLDSPPEARFGGPAAASHTAGPETNRAVLVRPAPSSLMTPPLEGEGDAK